jgi:peptidoglycan/xylan/chitin deacetylase (PgdA/CDA1 family)
MRSGMLYIAVLFLLSHKATAKEIAITFDDAPRFARGYFDGPTRAIKLIDNLQKASIDQVAFFSVSKELNEEGTARIDKYANAGHLIANHTNTHPDFNVTSLSDYKKDFITADDKLSHFKNFIKWFRFPYLREGNDLEKRDGMRKTLNDMGYTHAYVTINNYDWYIEDLFQKAIKNGKKIDFEKLKKFYVSVLIDGVEYYDQMAVRLLERSPKHVILLHETDINALFIGDLAQELKNRGWKIISPKAAYEDKISNYLATTVARFNPGRIGEIARDRGETAGLWHEACNETYLENRFNKEVIQEK